MKLPTGLFDEKSVSFTYGDLFPAFRFKDGRPYREKVYNLEEIKRVIDEFGWPQEWNHDGKSGPERYVEAQIWDDGPIKRSGII